MIEQARLLPAYSMYSKVNVKEVKQPSGFVTFTISERTQRVLCVFNYDTYSN